MHRRTSDAVHYSTGQAARRLGISREQLLRDLATLGIEPARDPLGYRLITGDELRRLEMLRADRRRRAQDRPAL